MVLLLIAACGDKKVGLEDPEDTGTDQNHGTPGDPRPHVDDIDNDCSTEGECSWWVTVSADPATSVELDIVHTSTDELATGHVEHHDAFAIATHSGEITTWALTLTLVDSPEEQVANESSLFDVAAFDARLTMLATAHGEEADDCLVLGHDPDYFELCPD